MVLSASIFNSAPNPFAFNFKTTDFLSMYNNITVPPRNIMFTSKTIYTSSYKYT